MRPNLFIIGASKCGTTFLHDVLDGHPEIYMSKIKELHFFTRCSEDRNIAQYEANFPITGSAKLYGESTPLYSETTFFPDVPKRLAAYSPEAKIVYLVRSPFDRLKSVYKQAMSTGHFFEKKYYNQKMPINYAEAVFNYPPFLEATRYNTHVKNYLEFFPKGAIHIIFFEDLITTTTCELRKLFQFLDVSPDVSLELDLANKNSGEKKKVFNPMVARLSKITPDLAKSVLPKNAREIVRNIITSLYSPQYATPITLSDQETARVREVLASEVEGIYRYTDRCDDPWNFFEATRFSG